MYIVNRHKYINIVQTQKIVYNKLQISVSLRNFY